MKKKLCCVLTALVLLVVSVNAQAPNEFNYQGVARDASGNTLPNKLIGLEFTIHIGTSGGAVKYQETQTTSTNQFGLFSVAIGTGTVVSGTFAGVNWGSTNTYLQVGLDPNGGTTFTDMGTSQLLSVPYALSAPGAGNWGSSGTNIYNTNSGGVDVGTNSNSTLAGLNIVSTRKYGVYSLGKPIGVYGSGSGVGDTNTALPYSYSGNSRVVGLDGEINDARGSNTTDEVDGVDAICVNRHDAFYNAGSFNYAYGATRNTYGSYVVGQTDTANYYTFGLYAQVNPDSGASLYGDYAGYFTAPSDNGNVYVDGTLTAFNKQFKIDDPIDPANKYLYHNCIESPDMMNMYNGNITTDANGNAVVILPQYFQAENKDFKYQLTVIGQFAQAIIGTKINNNQFTIKTDKPNVEVSWQVTGVRNDPWANAHSTAAEVEKKGIEKGRYLTPQYYGQPSSMSIGYLMSACKKYNAPVSLEK